MFVGWMDRWMDGWAGGWLAGFISYTVAMWTLEPRSVSGFPRQAVMRKDLEIILFFINSNCIAQWYNILKRACVQVSNFYVEFPLRL